MNFVSLFIHGLSALFASYEVVSTRLLVGTGIISALALFFIMSVVLAQSVTHFAVSGWVTGAAALLLVITFELVTAAFGIIFSVMMNRNNLGFLPLRDYSFFVAGCSEICPHDRFRRSGKELEIFTEAQNAAR